MMAGTSETNGPTAGNSRFDRNWVAGRRLLVAADDMFYLDGGNTWSSWLAADCAVAHLILCDAVRARQQGRKWQRMVYYAMEHVLNDHVPNVPGNCRDVCDDEMVPARVASCVNRIAAIAARADRADRAHIRQLWLLTLPEHRQAEIRNDEKDATALYSAVALKMSIAAVSVVARQIEAPKSLNKNILPPPVAKVSKQKPIAETLIAPVTEERTLPPPIAAEPKLGIVAEPLVKPETSKKRTLPPPIARVSKLRPVAKTLVEPLIGKRTLPPPIAEVPDQGPVTRPLIAPVPGRRTLPPPIARMPRLRPDAEPVVEPVTWSAIEEIYRQLSGD